MAKIIAKSRHAVENCQSRNHFVIVTIQNIGRNKMTRSNKLLLKLVVFALADGWSLLAASLVNSFKVT
jgi:type III secretory pathway component EscR